MQKIPKNSHKKPKTAGKHTKNAPKCQNQMPETVKNAKKHSKMLKSTKTVK